MSDRPVRPDGDQLDPPLTEHSAPGSYFVITASRTIYQVDVVAGDSSPTITRYPRANSLPLDGEPLTGVRSFFFDPTSGLGQIQWWKHNVADRDRPDRHYAGTVRTTSAVLLMLGIHHTTDGTAESNPADTTNTRLLLDGLRSGLAAVELDEDFVELLRMLAQHGLDKSGPEAHDADHRGNHDER